LIHGFNTNKHRLFPILAQPCSLASKGYNFIEFIGFHPGTPAQGLSRGKLRVIEQGAMKLTTPDLFSRVPELPHNLRYGSEDDRAYVVSDGAATNFVLPKNRAVPKPFVDKPPQPLTPAFRLLVAAFVGLAPAGLGTIVLAPLAVLWSLAVLLTRPLNPADRKRVVVVCAIAAVLLALAIPLSELFFARLSP
jgi:hypothetical protein